MNTARAGMVALLVVLVLAGAAWLGRGTLFELFSDAPAPVEVSPQAAAAAEAKLERLRSDQEEVSLTEVEVTSLLRYRSDDLTRSTLRQASVRFGDDTLRITGYVPTDRLPSHPELDRVRPLLPDSAEIDLIAELRPLDSGRIAVNVRSVEFAGLPVPERYYGQVLERLGREDEPGLPETALAVRLPAGVRGVQIRSGRLILVP